MLRDSFLHQHVHNSHFDLYYHDVSMRNKIPCPAGQQDEDTDVLVRSAARFELP